MRPRNIARPAAAGALCLAFTCAAGRIGPGSDNATVRPVRQRRRQAADRREPAQAQRARRRSHRRRGHGRARRRRRHRLAADPARARWKPIDRDRTDACGPLQAARAPPTHRQHAGARPRRRRRPASPTGKRRIGRLNVYKRTLRVVVRPRPVRQPLACGGTLSTGTLGVAHKTLPCGTKVTFKRGDRTVRVPVIDRGPYVGGREYDLTAATAQRARLPRPRRDPDDALATRAASSELRRRPARPRRGPLRRLGVLERRHAHAEQPHRAAAARTRAAARCATPVIVAVSFTGGGERAGARDRGPVVEPDLDRDRAPAHRLAPQPLARARPASRASTASSSARSPMSRSNVVSFERDFAGPDSASTTVRAVEVRARDAARARGASRSAARAAPRRRRWSAPIVVSPSAASRSAVFGPIPGMIRSDAPASRRQASSRPIATKPCGFSRSEATFAISRFGPTPTEIPMPVRARTSATRSRSTRSGFSASVTSA